MGRRRRPSPPLGWLMKLGRSDAVSTWFFGAGLVLAPLALGGALPAMLLAICAWFSVAGGLVALRMSRAPRIEARPIVWASLVALMWTALQAVPLPCEWVKTLRPKNVAGASLVHQLLDLSEAPLCALSVDVGQTRYELMRGAAVVTVFLCAYGLAAIGRRNFIYRAVAVATGSVALTTLVHVLLGAERVYGLYKPVYAAGAATGPVMNPNHLAGLLAFGLPLQIALGLRQTDSGRRVLWFATAVLATAVALITQSRWGVASIVVGAMLVPVGVGAAKRSRRAWTVPTLAAAIPIIALVLVGGERLRDTYAERDLSKLGALAQSGKRVWDAPFLGVGRGGFAAVSVDEGDGRKRQTVVENLPLLWTIEWGLPLSALLLASIATGIWRASRCKHTTTQFGAIGALVVVGVHDQLDFMLELAGAGALAAAVLGAVLAPSRSSHAPLRHGRVSLKAVTLGTSGLLVLAVAAFGPRAAALDRQSVELELTRLLKQKARHETLALLRIAAPLHPNDPQIAILAGTFAARNGAAQTAGWINHAMRLAPGWASPHLLAAAWLGSRGHRDQAMLEVVEAEDRVSGSGSEIACSILRAEREPVRLVRVVQRHTTNKGLLEALAGCLNVHDPRAPGVDLALAQSRPDLSEPRLRESHRLLLAGRPRQAVRILREVPREHRDAKLYAGLAKALSVGGDFESAISTLAQARSGLPDRPSLIEAEARVLARAKRPEGVRARAAHLLSLARGEPRRVWRAYRLLGDLETRLGNLDRALAAYENAYQVRPDRGTLEHIARTAQRLGRRGRARRAYTDLVEQAPHAARYREALKRLEGGN